jgi:hypothetical protein
MKIPLNAPCASFVRLQLMQVLPPLKAGYYWRHWRLTCRVRVIWLFIKGGNSCAVIIQVRI